MAVMAPKTKADDGNRAVMIEDRIVPVYTRRSALTRFLGTVACVSAPLVSGAGM